MIIPARLLVRSVCLVTVSWFAGCTTFHTVSMDDPPTDSSNELRLMLVDGREVNYEPGSYRIVRRPDSSYVERVGSKTGDSVVKNNFEDRIHFEDIDEIQVEDRPFLKDMITVYAVSLGVLVAVVYAVVLIGGIEY